MDMRPQIIKRRRLLSVFIVTLIACAVLFSVVAIYLRRQSMLLVVRELETGKVYAEVPVKTGDEVSFEWEHSFEHIPWYEYYEVQDDGSFLLNSIAVAGFGAGIPAEMDVTYRYEDGLIYMEGIGSVFEQFNWINSKTALNNIKVKDELLLLGSDMPHHVKMELFIEK